MNFISLDVFEKHPFRRACWCMLLLLSCSRVENQVLCFCFLWLLSHRNLHLRTGKILPWQQRCGCRRTTFPGNGSVKRGSLLLCMKGAGNKNMHECSAQLANQRREDRVRPHRISSPMPRFMPYNASKSFVQNNKSKKKSVTQLIHLT